MQKQAFVQSAYAEPLCCESSDFCVWTAALFCLLMPSSDVSVHSEVSRATASALSSEAHAYSMCTALCVRVITTISIKITPRCATGIFVLSKGGCITFLPQDASWHVQDL